MPSNGRASTTTLKALRVLECVAGSSEPIALSEVSSATKLDKSTAYRMLATLLEAGYVRQDEFTKRYRLSYRAVSLSRNLLAENEVSQLTLRELQRLSGETGESIDLAVIDGSETVLVQRVKGTQLVGVDFQVGDRSPLHCTSIGKALLAFQDPTTIDEILSRPLRRFASHTLVDPAKLRAELDLTRQRGYAIDDHELSDSMRCIAAPIFERDSAARLGISVSGPDSRFTLEYLDALRPRLLESTTRLSEQLGGLAFRTAPA